MTMRVGELLIREAGLADRVAQHMTELVVSGALSRGARIPPERVLAEQYGVSRTVIREAVRTLVSKGLLEARGGSGIYVRNPDPSAAAESVALMLRLHHGNTPILYETVHEMRWVLEPEIARLAANRATPGDIEFMAQQIERQRGAETRDEYVQSDVAFHAALATATRNALFSVLLNSISDVMTEVRQMGYQVTGSHAKAVMHHTRILNAIQEGDAAAAGRAMRAHLRDSEQVLLQGLKLEAARAHHDP